MDPHPNPKRTATGRACVLVAFVWLSFLRATKNPVPAGFNVTL